MVKPDNNESLRAVRRYFYRAVWTLEQLAVFSGRREAPPVIREASSP